jgi:hypothetical protein
MRLILILLLLWMTGCEDEVKLAAEYSNRQSLWDYCNYQADYYDTTLRYINTIEMDIDSDSILIREVNCPKTGSILTTTKWVKQ